MKPKLLLQNWSAIPLTLISLGSFYTFTQNSSLLLQGGYISIFDGPVFVSLFIVLFSIIYIYKTITKAPRHFIAKIIAYLFTSLLVPVLVILLSQGGSCSSIMSPTGSCYDSLYFAFWLVFFNPFVIPFALLLSITGLASLLFGPSSNKA